MLWTNTNHHEHHDQQSSDEHQKWESFEEEEYNHGDGSISAGHNEIDEVEQFPVDLSNDIAVNQMLADQGAPFNPDAEIFDVNDFAIELQRNSRMGGNYDAQSNEQHQLQQQFAHQNYDDEQANYKKQIKK